MFFFKSIDKKFEEIGFKKIKEDKYGVQYERINKSFGYTQMLDIYSKHNGRHIMLSYQKNCNSDGFNNCVGLTGYEIKLALKKMYKLKLYSRN